MSRFPHVRYHVICVLADLLILRDLDLSPANLVIKFANFKAAPVGKHYVNEIG